MPKTYSTPSASRHSTNTSDALRLATRPVSNRIVAVTTSYPALRAATTSRRRCAVPAVPLVLRAARFDPRLRPATGERPARIGERDAARDRRAPAADGGDVL